MLTIEEQLHRRFLLQESFVNELLHICSLPSLWRKLPGHLSRVAQNRPNELTFLLL